MTMKKILMRGPLLISQLSTLPTLPLLCPSHGPACSHPPPPKAMFPVPFDSGATISTPFIKNTSLATERVILQGLAKGIQVRGTGSVRWVVEFLGLTALNSLLQYVNWLVWEVCSVN